MAKYLRFPDEEEYISFLKNPAKWDELWDEQETVARGNIEDDSLMDLNEAEIKRRIELLEGILDMTPREIVNEIMATERAFTKLSHDRLDLQYQLDSLSDNNEGAAR